MMLYDENDMDSNSMDTGAIREWLDEQGDDGSYCPSCMTRLVKTNDDDTYYCPNDMCIDERHWATKED